MSTDAGVPPPLPAVLPPPLPPQSLPWPQARGLGGWLVLPMIALFLSPVVTIGYFIAGLGGDASALGKVGSLLWASRSDPAALWDMAQALGPDGAGSLALAAALIALGSGVGIAAPIVLLVLMFRHSRFAPMGMIMFFAANLLLAILVIGLERGGLLDPDPTSAHDVVRAAIGAAIWIPYFTVSRRVKNTFVM